MEKLYITPKNGSKPYINDKGEVVIDLRPQTLNSGNKQITTDGVEFRVVHSYKTKDSEDEKFRIGDKGFLRTNKNHELSITRKTNK